MLGVMRTALESGINDCCWTTRAWPEHAPNPYNWRSHASTSKASGIFPQQNFSRNDVVQDSCQPATYGRNLTVSALPKPDIRNLRYAHIHLSTVAGLELFFVGDLTAPWLHRSAWCGGWLSGTFSHTTQPDFGACIEQVIFGFIIGNARPYALLGFRCLGHSRTI